MQTITLRHPGKIVFGAGCFQQFVEDFAGSGYKRLFVLSIAPMKDFLIGEFKAFKKAGIEFEINVQIQNEPTFNDFEELLAQASAFKADSVVGIGGGSVMDSAKLLAALLYSPQKISDVVGIGLLKSRSTYLACLPTTAGTGSEVSPNAIFLDESDHEKKGVISPFLVADAAYIDPQLTYGVPTQVTAATGIDALTHCLEAYVNNFAHPIVDLYALEGIKLIAENIVEAVHYGNNAQAREAVALGSLYGGMCLGPVNTGAIHALSYPLGSKYKIAHGLANALLMPYVVDFNLEEGTEKYAKVAQMLGAKEHNSAEETAREGVVLLKKLCSDCGLPVRLSEVGISENDFENMATDALKVQRLLKNNVRKVTFDDAVEIYKNAF